VNLQDYSIWNYFSKDKVVSRVHIPWTMALCRSTVGYRDGDRRSSLESRFARAAGLGSSPRLHKNGEGIDAVLTEVEIGRRDDG
jgi:hypothetical protein